MRSSAPPHGRTADGVLAALLLLACVAAVPGCRSLPWRGSSDAPAASADLVEYRVKPGDTVERVAAWHGVEPSEVRRHNGLDGDDALAAGRTLRIPARPLGRHRVAAGETLGQIGQKYGADVRALIRLNDVADVRRLQVGQEIRIPADASRGPRPVASQAAAAPPRPAVRTRTAKERSEPAPSDRQASARATSERAKQPPAPAAHDSPAPAATTAAVAPPPAPARPQREPDRIAPPPARMEVDQALLRAAHAFDDADFDGALAAAERARRLLPAEPTDPADRRRLARAHLLAGMAHVALDRGEEARRSIRTALALDETIQIDPDRASPTVAAAFRDAQQQ